MKKNYINPQTTVDSVIWGSCMMAGSPTLPGGTTPGSTDTGFGGGGGSGAPRRRPF